MIKAVFRNLKDPRGIAIKLIAKLSPLIKSDRLYLSMRYWLFMKKSSIWTIHVLSMKNLIG